MLQQGVDPEDAPSALINQITKEELNHWLPHFVMEARRQDGKSYPLNTLYISIVLWSFKTHPNYSAKIEHLYGCRTHRFSENLECTNEEIEEWGNWQHQASSRTHLTGRGGTIVDYWTASCKPFWIPPSISCCVAWVTRWARTSPAKLESITDYSSGSVERKHLLFVEDVSKNNCGGLKMRKVQPKLFVYLKSTVIDVHQIDPNQAFI